MDWNHDMFWREIVCDQLRSAPRLSYDAKAKRVGNQTRKIGTEVVQFYNFDLEKVWKFEHAEKRLVQIKILRAILSWSLQCRSMWLAKVPTKKHKPKLWALGGFVTQLMHREFWQKEWGVLQTLTHSHSTDTSISKWNKFGNSQILIFIPLPRSRNQHSV